MNNAGYCCVTFGLNSHTSVNIVIPYCTNTTFIFKTSSGAEGVANKCMEEATGRTDGKQGEGLVYREPSVEDKSVHNQINMMETVSVRRVHNVTTQLDTLGFLSSTDRQIRGVI